jgi:tRNA(Ile)-lysidine synthase
MRVSALALAGGPVTVRSRAGGERLQPDARRPRRSLKNLLQESAIPPWERERLPLVYCGEHLVCVPQIGVDAAFQPGRRDLALFVSWQRLHYTENGKKRALHDRKRQTPRATKRTPR